jgi:hypothetical protein
MLTQKTSVDRLSDAFSIHESTATWLISLLSTALARSTRLKSPVEEDEEMVDMSRASPRWTTENWRGESLWE